MRTKNIIFMLLLVPAILLSGCKKDEPVSPETESSSEVATSSNGELKSIVMGTDGNWYAESTQNWCQLSQTAGEGKQTVQINTVYNHTSEKRTATISVYSGNAEKKFSVKGGSPVQTFTITQEANLSDTKPAHFTDIKQDGSSIKFKLWTGAGGTINDVEGSSLKYYTGGSAIADRWLAETPNIETNWAEFKQIFVEKDVCWGKIAVGEQQTINAIRIDQSHTLKKLNDQPVQGTADIHFVLNGKLYYGGGFYTAHAHSSGLGSTYDEVYNYDFYRFDPNTQNATKLGNLPFNGGKVALLNGIPYVLANDNSVYKYDVSSDTWSEAGSLSPGESILAFYAQDNILYLTGANNRYAYRWIDNEFILQNTISHGMNFAVPQAVSDLAGNVWLCSNNTVYKHTNNGYTQLSSTTGYLLGAHQGEVYIHSPNEGANLQKITSSGETKSLDLFFSIKEYNDGIHGYIPQKYAENIDGILYIFGGSKKSYTGNISDEKRIYSSSMYWFNVKNYQPVSIMLVTETK